jgi:CRP-like cAMP-binding protein
MTGTHFLHNISLFANLSEAELEPLAQRLIARKYRPDESIFAQGSPGNSLYIVKSGLVDIVLADSEDHTQTLAQFGPGQIFGEFSLLDGLPRSAGAVARERCELLILTRPEFFMYLEQHPSVAINLLILLSRRLRFAMQRTGEDHQSVSSLVRLAHILTQFAERYGYRQDDKIHLEIRLTPGELAGLMDCPRSEAQSALETLQQRGLVDTQGLQMTISDLEGLRGVAHQAD